MKPVTFIVIGAGSRGHAYAKYALERPDRARCVGVAEPREVRRQHLASEHGLTSAAQYADWRELVGGERQADAVLITTQDADHAEPAVALAGEGYHILLEKPMATTEDDCRRIVDAVGAADVMLAVCHVLRYTAYTRKLKAMIGAGAIGDVLGLDRLEPVGWWHYAHSYVRGNWRTTRTSTPMLMAKCCHDLDWILHVMGGGCQSVASFGSLVHFRADRAPAGAGQRCLDCPVEADCPYSAVKIYLQRVREGHTGWPVDVLTMDAGATDEQTVTTALRDGPYGRCVYHCDNDVADQQVVAMEFDGGRVANFIVSAFTPMAGRQTRLYGSRGQLCGDGRYIHHLDFLTGQTTSYDSEAGDAGILGGHGGGDYALMEVFIAAVAAGDESLILSGPAETLMSHRMIFAAERARTERRVVEL